MPLNAEADAASSALRPPVCVTPAAPSGADRVGALLEVLICSGYPTQIGIGAVFAAAGFGPGARMSIGYVLAVSLLDTVVVVGLILAFLRTHGESPRALLLGRRRPFPEALTGIPMIFIAFGIAIVVLGAILVYAPWLHNVTENPLQDLISTRGSAALFGVVVVIAGGVREEIQRAFVLSRFEGWLGGTGVGVVLSSAAFGAGHLMQGQDAAIATALLGAFWAVVYVRRRSVVSPIVSHSGFNLLQLAQYLVIGR
jgi:membrane protease YdiL (CAAX protease family)